MESLEARIHYHFRQPALLDEALTHASLRYETRRSVPDNQRLEFLGDAVLQLVLSEALYTRLLHSDEGILTKLRTRLVSEAALARIARSIDLGAHLKLGRGEEGNGGRERDSTLADTVESLIGAVYLDGGMEAAKPFVLSLSKAELQTVFDQPVEVNPKGQLQELLQAEGCPPPNYSFLKSDGPDHLRVFSVAVLWQGRELGRGEGRSKKDAEIAAAKAALEGSALPILLHERGLPAKRP